MSRDDEAKLSVPVTKADHIAGGAAALVTLIEYGDYQCPFCGQAYPILQAIQRQLGPRLRFVFRNFPLTNAHPFAEAAAEAAEAAAEQGQFWEMHDLLYENQANLGPQLLVEAASKLSLDVPVFLGDLRARKYKERVRRDFLSMTPALRGLGHRTSWLRHWRRWREVRRERLDADAYGVGVFAS
jgi:predicted DsbA family dithiol-disulfide isomerase